jgi:hypothetical protein
MLPSVADLKARLDKLEEEGKLDVSVELLTFFYLLVRDALPAGEVVRIVREAKRSKGQEAVFTSAPMERLARDLLADLVG